MISKNCTGAISSSSAPVLADSLQNHDSEACVLAASQLHTLSEFHRCNFVVGISL